MGKIGVFYGSDTGSTEVVKDLLVKEIGKEFVHEIDAYKLKISDFDNYDKIIIGLSTWYDGDLQSDWENFFDDFKTIDFTGKKVAIFGLGVDEDNQRELTPERIKAWTTQVLEEFEFEKFDANCVKFDVVLQFFVTISSRISCVFSV